MPVMTTATMAMTSVLLPAVTFRWRYYSSFFFCSLLTSISIPASNSKFLNPSQVPPSASQLHNRSLHSAAGTIFFGVTYDRCFTSLMPPSLSCLCVSLPAALHLALIKPSVLLFIQCIASHFIRLPDQKKRDLSFYTFFFLLIVIFFAFIFI